MLSLEKSKAKVERYDVNCKYNGFFVLVTETECEDGKCWSSDFGYDFYGNIEHLFAITEKICKTKQLFLATVRSYLVEHDCIEDFFDFYMSNEFETMRR